MHLHRFDHPQYTTEGLRLSCRSLESQVNIPGHDLYSIVLRVEFPVPV